ncbi:MAG: hypothetical protein EOO78_01390 [Oxalobacteraceae bacterium]|nr:MAG: hypothetical protein EOO78_01390 [Oxalobacteraceae bacterium]
MLVQHVVADGGRGALGVVGGNASAPGPAVRRLESVMASPNLPHKVRVFIDERKTIVMKKI